MTTPYGGTPAPPDPHGHNHDDGYERAPADGRARLFLIVGLLAVVAMVIFGCSKGDGWDNPFKQDTAVTETVTPSSQPSDTAAPSTTVADPEAEVPPVVPANDIASCGEIWSWKSFDDCVDKVASWMPAEFDKSKDVSKLSYAQVEDWAKRFPDVDARVITVYNDVAPIMTDEEVRAKAAEESKLSPSVAARLHITRTERDFPGWYTVNTANLENQRMNPFRDDRPDQVRVTLVPLDKDGKIDMAMVGSGVFGTCLNKKWLQLPPPVESTTPPEETTTTSTTTSETTTTPSTSTTTTTPSTSTTTTTTSTTTTTTSTTETSPPKNPDGGPDETRTMTPPSETDAETVPPPPPDTPLNPTITTDAPTLAPPVEETSSPPPVPTDLPGASETVTTTIVDPGAAP